MEAQSRSVTWKRIVVPTLLSAVAMTGAALSSSALFPTGGRAPEGLMPAAEASGPIPGNDVNIFVELSRKVVPSVVNIYTATTVRSPHGHPDDMYRRFFEEFFGGQGGGRRAPQQPFRGQPQPRKAMSLGTGFIVDNDGLILTNNHVIDGADEIKVKFTEDGSEEGVDAKVVGQDPELDLAILRVTTKRKLVALPFGDSDRLQVGEYVMAVGNPFGQGHSVTHGIISAKDRVAPGLFAKYLQTDAPINPGNSGGPLVNLRGEVIGVNNAIDARAQGIGFAIPINSVKTVLPELKSKGKVARGYVGIMVGDIDPKVSSHLGLSKDVRGAFVEDVVPNLPAEKAGIKAYDVVVEFGGKKIESAAELVSSVVEVPVGQTVDVKVIRSGKERTFKLTVAERPSGAAAGAGGRKKRGGGGDGDTEPERSIEPGMGLADLTPESAKRIGVPESTQGVLVTELAYGGPAAEAGLRSDDVILEVDRKPVKSAKEFFDVVKEKKSYLLRVMRAGPSEPFYRVLVLDLSEGKTQ